MTSASDPDPLPPLASAMPSLPVPLSHFLYSAQTEQGFRFNGTVEALDGSAAVHLLESMRLRVTEIKVANKPATPTPLLDDPFLVFNQQLAQLSRNGMPIEKGVRLIATDLRRGRFARAVALVSADLGQGVALKEAFARHRRQFPRIYGKVLDAAVSGGDVPPMLLNLGRHIERENRLRSILWRTVAGPLMTLCALLLVVSFIGLAVVPQFQRTFADMRVKLPLITESVIRFAGVAPYLAAGVLALIILLYFTRGILRLLGAQSNATDRLLLWIPMVAAVLRFNLIARWIDAVRIGVLAGLELPAAVKLAGEATGSRALRRDGLALVSALSRKRALSTVHGAVLPDTIPAALETSAGQRDLHDTLATLCDLYARQAELRLQRIPAIVMPMLVILVALLVGCILCGLLLPLIWEIQNLAGFKI